MKSSLFYVSIFSAFLSLGAKAETAHYEISGMTCGSCVKNLKAAVCDKLKDEANSCDVKVGSLHIVTKEGKAFDAKKVEALIANTEYKITKSEIKK